MPSLTNEKSNKNNIKKKNKKTKDSNQIKNDKFDFDEEIVIGLRTTESSKNNKKNKKRKNNTKKSVSKEVRNDAKNEIEEPSIIIQSKYIKKYEEEPKKDVKKKKNKKKKQPVKNNKNQELRARKRKAILKIVKWFTLIAIVAGGIVFAMLSPIFNITSIVVNGNSKISSETIISLSGLEIDQNIFRFNSNNVKNNIKQNTYIDSVEIKREFPDTIEIVVEEREPTFMLTYGNAYVYINNQGYILEIASEKREFPILTGYETPTEQIVEGNRLNVADLEKLNDVLRIMETVSNEENKISDLITQIDITDKDNYILTLEKEKKLIYLGDTTNLSTKVLWINKFLEEEKGNEGIIYLNINLNTERPYFRERV